MPQWAGKWKGGRFYVDAQGRQVFFIERRRRSIRLATHDPELAVGELARFLADPAAYCRALEQPVASTSTEAVHITKERLTLYIESLRAKGSVEDHRKARRAYLHAWSETGIDLRTVDRKTLRATLADFEGGHRGRTEALNAFCRWLVKEGDLQSWNPLVNTRKPAETRAERVCYSLEELAACYQRLSEGPIRDVFHLRAATGMHGTEIKQLEGCRVYQGPLPDKGAGIRVLGAKHAIQGVVQVMHKSKRRHRLSLDAAGLAAALRLREGVPYRVTVWKALDPIVPSNLRHTFDTLAGEVGEWVTWKGAGVDRSRVAQVMGHRAGSTMGPDRYEKTQVPPMIRLPLVWL